MFSPTMYWVGLPLAKLGLLGQKANRQMRILMISNIFCYNIARYKRGRRCRKNANKQTKNPLLESRA